MKWLNWRSMGSVVGVSALMLGLFPSEKVIDTAPPKVSDITVSASEVVQNGNSSVEVTFRITDDSGVVTPNQGWSLYSSPDDMGLSGQTECDIRLISGTDKNGVWGCTLDYASVSVPGKWGISHWPLEDRNGHNTAFVQIGDVTVYKEALKNTGIPVITGGGKVGETLSASSGSWSATPTAVSYQWSRGGVNIPGANAAKYTVTASDYQKPLSVEVSASRVAGGSAFYYLPATAKSAAFTPSVSGSLKPGVIALQELDGCIQSDATGWLAANSLSSEQVAQTTYQWQLNGKSITGATAAEYCPIANDSKKTLTLATTFTVTGFDPFTQKSEAHVVGDMMPPADIVSHPVRITQAEGVLTVASEAWTLPGEPTTAVTDLKYVWKRAGVVIDGATAKTYTLKNDDYGQSFTVAVTGAAKDFESVTVVSAAFVPSLYELPDTDRLAGDNRFATAVEISQSAFKPGTAEWVVVATGYGFADALSAAPLAKVAGGPLLLTQQDVLTAETKAEIKRLGAENVLIVGGEPSVSKAVEAELDGMDLNVIRAAGADRFETSLLISQLEEVWTKAPPKEIFIATGLDYPDALAAGAAAAGRDIPVLLVNGQAESLTAEQLAQIKIYGVEKVHIAGSSKSVSDAIKNQLEDAKLTVTRYAGVNRIETSALIADTFAVSGGTAYIAQGWNYPDALAGGAVAGIAQSALLLSQPNCFSEALRDPLVALQPSKVTLLGSEASLSRAVAEYDSACG